MQEPPQTILPRAPFPDYGDATRGRLGLVIRLNFFLRFRPFDLLHEPEPVVRGRFL